MTIAVAKGPTMHYLELPEQTRLSLARGFVERAWQRPGCGTDTHSVVDAQVGDARAHRDGLRLRVAFDGLFAADSFAALNVAEQAYDALARELNARYGDGLVVGSSESEAPGIRGFRGQEFATRSSVLVGEELIAI